MDQSNRFSSDQWLEGLLPEIRSAHNVLRTADKLLRSNDSSDRNIDSVIALYSIGIERFLKLVLGTIEVSKGHGWPPNMGSTRKGWGHAIDEMEQRLREDLRTRLSTPDFVSKRLPHQWLCTIDQDLVWQQAVGTFRNYAEAGRYHHLDQISGIQPRSQSYHLMWNKLEQIAIESKPKVRKIYELSFRDVPFNEYEKIVHATIADSIKRWMSIVCLFGFHGVLGPDWKIIGSELLPDGAINLSSVSTCE